jgi:hypothetical protein
MALFTWLPPTQREDGTALTGGEIHHYVIKQVVGDNEWYYETTSPPYDVPTQGGEQGEVSVAVVDTQFVTSDYYILGVAMTAYVKNANGDWNNPALWTPNGIPSSSDTVNFSTFETTIPAGYTVNCGGFTSFAGTNTSTRARLTIAGTLALYADVTQGIWTTLSFVGTGKIDTRGFSYNIDYTDGFGSRCEVISDGTGVGEITSSTTLGHFGGTGGGVYYGKLDLTNFRVSNVSFMYGAGWYPLNPYKLQNVLFYNCGRIENDSYIDDDADWEMVNVMFVDTQNTAEDQKAWLYCRPKGGTITGTRVMQNIVFDYRSTTNASVRFNYFPSELIPTDIYLADCYLEGLNIDSPRFERVFSNSGVVGEGGFPVWESYIVPNVNNPHTLQNLTTHLKDVVLESIQPLDSTDSGDHMILPKSGTSLMEKSLIIDNYGGVILNALGLPDNTGIYTLDHVTYVCDQRDPNYGKAARNENSGRFDPSSNAQIKNSIFHNRSNPSGSTTGRVFNIETAGDDQIEYVDYNVYNINSSSPSNIYFGVTSATKGAIGSQTGWGLNDLINVNPNFVDQFRGLVSWAAQYGASGYDEAVDYLIYGILGYDAVTNRLNSGLVTGETVEDLRLWVTAGFAPTNVALHNTAGDGLDRGYVPYQSLPTGGSLKYWNGSAWDDGGVLKYWNGSAWVVKTLKYWNGSTWK